MKPIFLSPEDMEELLEEIRTKMRKARMLDGRFELKQDYTYKGDLPKARLFYTSTAWAKMKQLVQGFTSEVGWHGLIQRYDDHSFIVKDIMVYPQSVTGATVTTDEEEYHKFLLPYWEQYAETPDTSINFHGHSHVNFGVSPSTTDLEDQRKKMESMKTGFYVFTIHNKSGDSNTWIYDFDNNIQYDNKEIQQAVLLNEGTLEEFMADAKKKVEQLKPPASKYPAYNNYAGNSYLPAAKKEESGKTEQKDEPDSKSYSKKDDFDNPYLPGYYPYGDPRYPYDF